MRRPVLVAFAVITLALQFSQMADADGPITVDCGDTPISGTVDLATLMQLESSIQGMLDNPTGTTCTLSQAPVSLALSIGSDPGDFVVGGGRFDRGPAPGSSRGCGVNFSLSAHADNRGFHGQQTYTINNADGCGDLGLQGHVKANVNCLSVISNAAQIKGTVTEVTGGFSSLIAVGDVLESDVVDNGPPSGGTPDRIDVFQGPPFSDATCTAANLAPFFPVENGNITVHHR
jgi:hypothetical protein